MISIWPAFVNMAIYLRVALEEENISTISSTVTEKTPWLKFSTLDIYQIYYMTVCCGFRCIGMEHCVGGSIVFDVSNECSAVMFRVKQSSARAGLYFLFG